jgi:hypothetical protein
MKLRSREIKENIRKRKSKNSNQKIRNLLVRLQRIQLPKAKVTKFNEKFTDLSNPGAYSRKSLKYMDGNKTDLVKQLAKNETYSLHKNVRKNFKRRKIVVSYPGQILQMDLVDMIKYSRQNSHYKYIINCVDLFSKKYGANR